MAFTLFMAIPFLTQAQSFDASGQLDGTFNPMDQVAGIKEGADGDVRTIVIQGDGKILIGGLFTVFNGVTVNRITRLNGNGSIDATFNPGGTGANGEVNRILLQPDGKIIVAGNFTGYNGIPANHIIRLNNDGSADGTFNTGSGTDLEVNTLAIQADGKVLVGGSFTSFNGSAANYLVRLTNTGTRDAAFNAPSITSPVNVVAIQADGKIVTGLNNNGNGLTPDYLLRLTTTGIKDAGFNVGGSGANNSVRAILLQPDGKILIGGDFTLYDNLNTNFTRLNPTGFIDPSFDNTSGGFAAGVKALALQPDGKVIVGWGNHAPWFDEREGVKVARVNGNGTRDTGFQIEFFEQVNENVYTIAIQPDGKILIGETFISKFNSRDRYGLFEGASTIAAIRDLKVNRYNADGSAEQGFCINALQTGANKTVTAVTIQPDGKLLAGGYFFSYNGTSTNFLTRTNTDGSKDLSFNPGGKGPNGWITSILLQPDGKILLAGTFTRYNNENAAYLVRLNTDGTRDLSFIYTEWTYVKVSGIALQPDGKIIVGGFGSVIRLNTNGSKDLSFNAGISSDLGAFFPYIYCIAVQPDGKILIGGDFPGVTGWRQKNIARFNADGSRDTGFDPVTQPPFGGASSIVTAIALQPDGKILFGGNFTNYISGPGTTSVGHLGRLNADGSLDASFNTGGSGFNSSVDAILVQADGKILAGGSFTTFNASAVNGLTRLLADGSRDFGFNPGGTGLSGSINAMALQPGGKKVLVAGDFKSYNSGGKNNMARIYNSSVSRSTTSTAVCASQLPYIWNGTAYNAPGTYTATLVSAPGQDSIATLILSIAASGAIDGPVKVCPYTGTATEAAYGIVAAPGSTLTWSVSKPATMLITSGQGTGQINIRYTADFVSGNINVKIVNSACSINLTRTLAVSKTIPSTPAAIVGNTNPVCALIGTADFATYTTRKANGATSYNWSAQAGTTTIIHPNGPGVNDTMVYIRFGAGFTTSAITVQSVNDCGTSSARSITVSRSNPSVPGAITGPVDVCNYVATGQIASYVVAPLPGLTYNWVLPPGASVVYYNTVARNGVYVTFDPAFTSGVLSVTALNGCGTSSVRKITLKKQLAATPGAITVAEISSCPNRVIGYSLIAMPANATSLVWTVPGVATILSGQGTTSITVSYPATQVSGYVTVQSGNDCSVSAIRKLNASQPVCTPPAPFTRMDNNVSAVGKLPSVTGDFETILFPNPGVTDFKLQVFSAAKEKIVVRVFDLQGRLISEWTTSPDETVVFGNSLKAGIYMVEVRQGNNVKITRAIKL